MRTHTIPAAEFDALASGYGGPSAIRTLRDAQLSKRLLLLRAVAALPGTDEAMAVLRVARTRAPDAVGEVLRHPFLDAWARQVVAGPAGVERFSSYAMVAAAAAGLDAELTMSTERGAVLLPGLGSATASGPAKVRSRGGRLVVESDSTVQVPDAAGWTGIRRATFGDLTVIVDDVDPVRARYSAPVTDRLSDGTYQLLHDRLAAAWTLISTDHPAHADALAAAPLTLVPLRRPGPGLDVSGTARTAFGAFGLSIPDTPATLAELILHEFAHTKLGGILDLVPLHDPTEPGRHFAGWHPELRPIGLLLQGTYAHLAVADFWRAHRHNLTGPARTAADHRYALNLTRVTDALTTLAASGELTDLGHRVTAAMTATITTWPPPPAAAENAAIRELTGRRAVHR